MSDLVKLSFSYSGLVMSFDFYSLSRININSLSSLMLSISNLVESEITCFTLSLEAFLSIMATVLYLSAFWIPRSLFSLKDFKACSSASLKLFSGFFYFLEIER